MGFGRVNIMGWLYIAEVCAIRRTRELDVFIMDEGILEQGYSIRYRL